MSSSTRSSNSPPTNRDYRESSVISIDSSDGENQDTNQDAPYELDEEYTVPQGQYTLPQGQYIVPQGHALAPVAAFLNKGKQRARRNEGAEDGDDEDGAYENDDVMLDGSYFFQNNQNGTAGSQQEINEWASAQLEKIDADIEAVTKRIEDLEERKKKAEVRAAESRTKHRMGYISKKWGQFQLDKALKVATDAEAAVKRTDDELLRVRERLHRLKMQREDIEVDTVRMFTEARAKYRPRKKRSLTNRHFPPEHNLDSGDDSLSDAIRIQDERETVERLKKGLPPVRKADRACRRCKLLKRACGYIPGTSTCDKCAITGQRCRYKENFQGNKQIRPWLVHNQIDELGALKAELAKFREKSTVSVGAENPLSGITGYGPPTQKLARQNWALMVRGHAPRLPLLTSTAGDHSSSVSAKRKSPTESNDAEPSQPAKRARQVANPPKQYSFQNETPETIAGPSKRGRKPGQTNSTRTTRPNQQTVVTPEDQNQPSDPSAYQFTFRCPPEDSTNPTQPPTADQPQTNAVSVSNPGLWWAQTISDRGGQLPANIHYMPDWPRWEDQMNEKQKLWFESLYCAGLQIPVVEGKNIEDDGGVEPLWPSWTRVAEELNQNQKEHLVKAVQGQFEIRELHGQDGVAQGTVDWQFAESQVQSQGQAPAQ